VNNGGTVPASRAIVLPILAPRRGGASSSGVAPITDAEQSSPLRLVSVHADVLRKLLRLRVPVQDLTPEGLAGSAFHIVGLTLDQREVLESWKVQVNDVTPDILETAADLVPVLESQPKPADDRKPSATPTSSSAHDTEVAVPMTEEPKHPAADLVLAASTKAPELLPYRLRLSAGGKHREVDVEGGKIILDGKSYASTTDALDAIATDERDWVFWEYFDAGAGKWRMLESEWRPDQVP
jgi:hypothetical protein